MPRSRLEQIVKEELAAHIKALREAPDDTLPDDDRKKPSKARKTSALEKNRQPTNDQEEKPPTPSPAKSVEPPVDDTSEDPSDDELAAADASDGEAEPEAGQLSTELEGKRIQSVTQEPKSQLVPGASEIVVTFAEVPDPLRIIVTKTGAVRFFYKTLINVA